MEKNKFNTSSYVCLPSPNLGKLSLAEVMEYIQREQLGEVNTTSLYPNNEGSVTIESKAETNKVEVVKKEKGTRFIDF